MQVSRTVKGDMRERDPVPVAMWVGVGMRSGVTLLKICMSSVKGDARR